MPRLPDGDRFAPSETEALDTVIDFRAPMSLAWCLRRLARSSRVPMSVFIRRALAERIPVYQQRDRDGLPLFDEGCDGPA